MIERFVSRNEVRWKRLASLLERAEELPEGALGPDSLEELVRLYRQAGSDLAQARILTRRRDILEPLGTLVARAHRFVSPAQPLNFGEEARSIFETGLPRTFQRRFREIGLALGLFLAGALFGAGAVLAGPENARRVIPAEFFSESPRERVQKIETDKERIETMDEALQFGASLYQHNIQVSFLAFALSAATLVGGAWLLFTNGVLLGAVATMYMLDGVTGFFVAWVGPHGALELPAIIFGAAAGFVLGQALFFPGNRSTESALRDALPDAARMLLAVVLQLLIAGLVEGSFSQFSQKTFSLTFKTGVAFLLFAGLVTYLFMPRKKES